MEKEKLLEVRHLKKYFSTPAGQLHAVDDVSFDIARGETLGVVGESGCGKSTLGRAVLRLHEPTSGEVLFRGENILAYSNKQMKDLKKEMQLIFQDPFSSLNPRMTVSQAIALPLLIQGVYDKKDKAALNQKVRELMDLVGLAQSILIPMNWMAAEGRESVLPERCHCTRHSSYVMSRYPLLTCPFRRRSST